MQQSVPILAVQQYKVEGAQKNKGKAWVSANTGTRWSGTAIHTLTAWLTRLVFIYINRKTNSTVTCSFDNR